MKGLTLIMGLLLSVQVHSQHLKIRMKNDTVRLVDFIGTSSNSVLTKSGHIPYSEIDTVFILATEFVTLRQLAYKVPVMLNGRQLTVKDLFIDELPFTNNGQLVFQKRFKSTSRSIEEMAGVLKSSPRTLDIIEKSESKLRVRVAETMTTYTRSGEPLAYEDTKMNYDILIELSDSVDVSISVVDFTLYAYHNSFTKENVKTSKSYFPADLFLKTNYYKPGGRKPNKRNLIYRDETLRIVRGVFNDLI